MNKKYNIVVVCILLLIGLILFIYKPDEVILAPEGKVGYKNATYMIEGEGVTLVNGVGAYQGGTATYVGSGAEGDLDRDGSTDSIFFLATSGSGSGTFYYVVPAFGTPTGFTGSNGIFIGDRIIPVSIEIIAGDIVVTYKDRLPSEPMTALPSIVMIKHFKINNGILVESLAPAPIAPSPVPVSGCYVGGCSSQICSDKKDMASTCEYNETYACYKTATCERQVSGECGWTSSPELLSCLGQ